MSELEPTQETFVVEMSKLFTPLSAEPNPGDQTATTKPDDEKFDKVAALLKQLGRREWSERPRLFTLLHMINRIQDMQKFVDARLKDINLPLIMSRLPADVDKNARALFIKSQHHVLTDASDLELENGSHRYFRTVADNHFNILKILGTGGFATVDHVQSKFSLDEFARKRILRHGAKANRDAIFENELHNLKRLRHIHLVRFVGSYTDPKYFGILMTPIAQCNLKTFLAETRISDGERSLLRQFFGCLCSALKYLHQKQCRHKDIKPQNILVLNHQVLITDFGTSRDWSDDTRATTTGDPGPFTRRYPAPEVADGERRGESADIWSLGCVYLEMMTVIKGRRVEDIKAFFTSHGTGRVFLHRNPAAIRLWLQNLQNVASDNEPIRWIQNMLKPQPRIRPSADDLFKLIQNHRDEHHFYGHCCGPDVAPCDGSSYAGSIVGCRDENSSYPSELLGISSAVPERGAESSVGSRVNDLPKTETDTACREPLATPPTEMAVTVAPQQRSGFNDRNSGYGGSLRQTTNRHTAQHKGSRDHKAKSIPFRTFFKYVAKSQGRSIPQRSAEKEAEASSAEDSDARRERRRKERRRREREKEREREREREAKEEEDRQKRHEEREAAKQAEDELQKRKDEERRRKRREEKEAQITRLAEQKVRKQEDMEDEARRQRRRERRHSERRLSNL